MVDKQFKNRIANIQPKKKIVIQHSNVTQSINQISISFVFDETSVKWFVYVDIQKPYEHVAPPIRLTSCTENYSFNSKNKRNGVVIP